MNRLLAVVALAAAPAFAEDAPAAPPPPAPTAEEIQKVTAYYLKGKDGGPILVEFSLCAELGKNEDGKTTCAVPLGDTIKKGDGITAFVKFFAPRGGKYEDLQVKFLLNGEVRTTSDMSVTESWTGYSNYKKTTASKAGTWEVQVLRADKVLASKTVKAE